jgi:hypothetical protein
LLFYLQLVRLTSLGTRQIPNAHQDFCLIRPFHPCHKIKSRASSMRIYQPQSSPCRLPSTRTHRPFVFQKTHLASPAASLLNKRNATTANNSRHPATRDLQRPWTTSFDKHQPHNSCSRTVRMSSKLIPANPSEVMVIRDVTPNIVTFSVPFARFGVVRVGGRGTLGKCDNLMTGPGTEYLADSSSQCASHQAPWRLCRPSLSHQR